MQTSSSSFSVERAADLASPDVSLRPHIRHQYKDDRSCSIDFTAAFQTNNTNNNAMTSMDGPLTLLPTFSGIAASTHAIAPPTPLMDSLTDRSMHCSTYAPNVPDISPKQCARRTPNSGITNATLPLALSSTPSQAAATFDSMSIDNNSQGNTPMQPLTSAAFQAAPDSGVNNNSVAKSVSSDVTTTCSNLPSEYGVESRKAVVLFVSPVNLRCHMAARFFSSRLTHHLAWGGDIARMFVLSHDKDAPVIPHTDPQWKDTVTSISQITAEFLGTQHVLGLTSTPTAVVLGDFSSENALSTAERCMLSAWEAIPGLKSSADTIGYRYIRFAEDWWDPVASPDESSLATRSFVDVNLTQSAIRMSKSRMGVVCASVVSYLTQVLPVIAHVHEHEPRNETGHTLGTMESLPPLFFTRHGQSEYNVEDRLGGDPNLTEAGLDDARAIGAFFEREVLKNPHLFLLRDAEWDRNEGFEVWCSQLRRTQQTAQPTANLLTNGKVRRWQSLNEIHAGVCEDMTNLEVMGQFPSLHNFRKLNKVAFRYPAGESYLDLMIRLKPVLLELQVVRKCVVVVAHQAVLRTVLSYFGGLPVEEAVTAECPHRTVWCCSFDKAGCPRLSTITLPSSTEQRNDGNWTGW